jgi:hypothetical protein
MTSLEALIEKASKEQLQAALRAVLAASTDALILATIDEALTPTQLPKIPDAEATLDELRPGMFYLPMEGKRVWLRIMSLGDVSADGEQRFAYVAKAHLGRHAPPQGVWLRRYPNPYTVRIPT